MVQFRRFQVGTVPRFLRRFGKRRRGPRRMDKVLAQVRDVFEEDHFIAQGDVVEEHEMLVNLPHVADMGNDRHSGFPAKQTHSDDSLMPATRTAST